MSYYDIVNGVPGGGIKEEKPKPVKKPKKVEEGS